MGQASRLRLALRARSRDARDLLMTRRRGSSGLAQLALHNPIYVSCVVLLLRHLFFPPHLFG